MAQALLIVGARIFLLLGIVHAILTLRDLSNPRTFTPTDASVRTAMQSSQLAIHPNTNLWKAWLGFNLSHSLGILLFGGELFCIGLFQFTLFAHNLLIQSVVILVSAAYFVMSLCFWFSRLALQPRLCVSWPPLCCRIGPEPDRMVALNGGAELLIHSMEFSLKAQSISGAPHGASDV